jgi:uncharacterized membrane protein
VSAPNPPVRPSGGDAADSSMTVKLLVAWAVVGIPLAWGVWHVVLNAMKLFK